MTGQTLPTELPRFAESFRVFIDDAYGYRMLTSEWIHNPPPRMMTDCLPQLARAGVMGFICSTRPDHEMSLKAYYGDEDYPVVNWIWKDCAWALHAGNPDEWCARRSIDRRLFDLPKGSDVPWLR